MHSITRKFSNGYFASIHWRIQLWYSVFLFTLLVVVLYFSLGELRKNTFEEIDRYLFSKVYVFSAAVSSKMEIDYAKKHQQQMIKGESPFNALHIITRWEIANGHEGRFVDAKTDLNDNTYRPYSKVRQEKYVAEMLDKGEYFVTFTPSREVFDRSSNAPSDVPIPASRGKNEPVNETWSRGGFREVLRHVSYDHAVLIGADLSSSDLYRDFRLQFWGYIFAAIIFYIASLVGGWLIIRRALRPIHDISQQVVSITSSGLNSAIDIQAYSDEFSPLSRALNDSFSQIANNFELQKRFVEDASHELKTPVTVLLTQAEYSLEKERDAEHYINALTVCQRNALVLKDLVGQLLYVSQLGKFNIAEASSPIHFDQLVAGCIKELEPLAHEKSLTIHSALSPCMLNSPLSLIHSLVLNIVSNAIRYNRVQGSIDIRCSASPSGVTFTVRDTGVGIADEDVPKIFHRFYRADKSRAQESGGTGLGLAIVKEICDLLDAEISVDSRLGEGSCFVVVFGKK